MCPTTLGHPWARADGPLVFGHRGGSKLAPENTLAAFDRGVAEGVDGLELDVHLSRDGEVVVCHDATLDRTTDASGPLSARTAQELAAVDAGHRFQDGNGLFPFRGLGLGIPTLREVLARYPTHKLIVELKDDTPEMARAALEVIRSAGAVGRTCLGSFAFGVLEAARRIEPSIATGASGREVRQALFWAWLGRLPVWRGYQALQLPEERAGVRVVSPRLIRAAHRAGVPVQVWIVDDEGDMRRLLGWGADAILTDRPDVAVPVVRGWRAR